jgi:hypothetical protein
LRSLTSQRSKILVYRAIAEGKASAWVRSQPRMPARKGHLFSLTSLGRGDSKLGVVVETMSWDSCKYELLCLAKVRKGLNLNRRKIC